MQMDASLVGQGFSISDLNKMNILDYQMYFDIIKERKEKEQAEYDKLNKNNNGPK
jgi:hypothetical protein